MSRTAKIVLIVVGSLTVIAVGLGFVAWRFFFSNFTTDPAEVSAIGQQIIPHELPAGYEGEFGTDLFGFRVMMAIDGRGTDSLIMLMSIPEGGSEADLRAASGDQLTTQRGANVDFEYVDTTEIEVRGETVALDRYRGTDNGVTVTQEIAVFETPDGRAGLLMLFADEDLYDDAGFDEFLASLE